MLLRTLLFIFILSVQTEYLFSIPISIKNKVVPYLLPADHPAKEILDQIFSKSRAILNEKEMEKAGFIKPIPRKYTHLLVVKHPKLKGYVIKAYLDAQRYFKNQPEYEHWIKRIQGAHLIRQYVEENELNGLFKVPQKWIYILPNQPTPPAEFLKKYTILIEEDMHILSRKANLAMWKSECVNEEFLTILHKLLKKLGLKDCAKSDNIPFCLDGRIAFIDTETFNSRKVLFKKLTPYLSSSMKLKWKKLIK